MPSPPRFGFLNITSGVRSHLVLRYERRLLKQLLAGNNDDDDSNQATYGLAKLDSGQEQLKSFWQPSLPAGPYSIAVKQTVKTDDKSELNLTASQHNRSASFRAPSTQPIRSRAIVTPSTSCHTSCSTILTSTYSDEVRNRVP